MRALFQGTEWRYQGLHGPRCPKEVPLSMLPEEWGTSR